MNPSRRPNLARLITEGGTPFTRIVIACYAVTFLAEWLLAATPMRRDWLLSMALFEVPDALHRPWTILTYALTAFGIYPIIFNSLFMIFIGASLERSWGTRNFAVFFFTMTLATTLGFILAYFIFHTPQFVISSLVLGALFIAFCILNPDETILIYFVIPVKTRWLMWAEIAIIFFGYGYGNPIMGFLALSGCAASWLWVRNLRWTDAFIGRAAPSRFNLPRTSFKASTARGGKRRDDDFSWRDLNPFERIARARRKKQFERLFEDDKDYKS